MPSFYYTMQQLDSFNNLILELAEHLRVHPDQATRVWANNNGNFADHDEFIKFCEELGEYRYLLWQHYEHGHPHPLQRPVYPNRPLPPPPPNNIPYAPQQAPIQGAVESATPAPPSRSAANRLAFILENDNEFDRICGIRPDAADASKSAKGNKEEGKKKGKGKGKEHEGEKKAMLKRKRGKGVGSRSGAANRRNVGESDDELENLPEEQVHAVMAATENPDDEADDREGDIDDGAVEDVKDELGVQKGVRWTQDEKLALAKFVAESSPNFGKFKLIRSRVAREFSQKVLKNSREASSVLNQIDDLVQKTFFVMRRQNATGGAGDADEERAGRGEGSSRRSLAPAVLDRFAESELFKILEPFLRSTPEGVRKRAFTAHNEVSSDNSEGDDEGEDGIKRQGKRAKAYAKGGGADDSYDRFVRVMEKRDRTKASIEERRIVLEEDRERRIAERDAQDRVRARRREQLTMALEMMKADEADVQETGTQWFSQLMEEEKKDV